MSINSAVYKIRREPASSKGGKTVHRLRFILRSYNPDSLEELCENLVKLATVAIGPHSISGPIRLPTKKKVYCVLTSPHVNKTSRNHFEIRTHKRILDIKNPHLNFYKHVVNLPIDPGVDVTLKKMILNKDTRS
mmetsp:Transcript_95413/g.179474  ORF Transcript_95413/g.179474 Transcript_95413/m.179474 type:complete len:134 (+) Transcript_95413:2-403(+)